jgi:serine/threonine-protein kinase RsbW
MVTFTDTISGDTATIVFQGDLTAQSLDALRLKLKTLIAKGAHGIVMDFSNVTTVDTSGVGLLAATYNSISKAKGTLKIIGASDTLFQFLTGLRLNAFFQIERKQH